MGVLPIPAAAMYGAGAADTLLLPAADAGPSQAPGPPMPSQAEPPDYSSKFNTPLTPEQEDKFQAWMKEQSQKRGYDMREDLRDYDLRGLFKDKGGFDARGHATDEYKKPNHPTFSSESKYSGVGGNVGGEWIKQGGKWVFQASPTNVQMYGTDGLQGYFKRVEPDSTLILPQGAQ